jgi:hypothetical protein
LIFDGKKVGDNVGCAFCWVRSRYSCRCLDITLEADVVQECRSEGWDLCESVMRWEQVVELVDVC